MPHELKTNNGFALSFNDILLVPQYNCLESRLETDISTRLTNHINIKHPICSSNMSTVTELKMMLTMWKSGSVGFLHRFMSPTEENNEKICEIVDEAVEIGINPIVVSIGVKKEDYSCVRC
jgi:IMP dehydrogenase